MKNIWIWNHYATNQFFDRSGRHYNFAKYLPKDQYNTTIFCASTVHNSDKTVAVNDKRYTQDAVDNIPFVFVKTPPYKGNGLSRVKNMLAFYSNVKKTAYELAQKEKPQIIIASSVHPLTCVAGIQVAKKLGIPCIVEIRDLWPLSIVEYTGVSSKNPVIWLLYRLEKWIYKNADKLIFTIEGGKDYIKDKGWENVVDLDKIYHINNGVDLDVFDENIKNNSVVDPDLDDDSLFKVIYTGSIRKANNIGLLLEAAKGLTEISNLKILIYGDGDDLVLLEKKRTTENIDNVIFKGRVAKANIPYILSKSNLSILNYKYVPMIKYGGSQNKLFEYFASGKPVLSTIKPGYDLVEKYSAGISLNNATTEGMQEAITAYYNLPKNEYEQSCNNARTAAKDYDFKNLTKKLISIIEETI